MKSSTLKLCWHNNKIIVLSSLFFLFFGTHIFASPGPTVIPALSRVYNNEFIGQVEQSPELGALGMLDATFNETSGSIGSIDIVAQTPSEQGGQSRAVVALPNGNFLVAISNPSYASLIAQYNAQGVLQTDSYGSLGIVTLGSEALPVQVMTLDVQGRALVGIGDDTTIDATGRICRINSDGQFIQQFQSLSWNFVGSIAEQSTGKIIAVGRVVASDSNVYTALARYNLDGSIDTNFGNAGIVVFNGGNNLLTSTTGSYSVVVDAQDRIYIPYIDQNGMVWVSRFTAAGIIDPTWFASFFGGMVPSGYSFITGTLTPTSSTIANFHTSSSDSFTNHLATFTVGSGFPYYTGSLTLNGFGSGTFTSNSGSFVTTAVAIPWLENATPSSLRMALDVNDNLLIGGQVGTVIRVDGIQASDGSHAFIDPFDSSTVINSDTLSLSSLITTQDNFIVIGGNDATTQQQIMIKLMGTANFDGPGHLDLTFNGTGYNFFQVTDQSGDITQANIFDLCLSPDGRIYAAGFQQINSTTNYPYISRVYNTLYDTQVHQSPATQEQGIIDFSFGQNSYQTYQGVVTPYLGSYRGNLEQEATAIIEVDYAMQGGINSGLGDLLVGSDGFTNTSNLSNLMLTWLTPQGLVDTHFGANSSGQLILNNESSSDEYFYTIAQDASGAIYVSGQANDLAILRKYSLTSTSNWTNGISEWSVTAPMIQDYSAEGHSIALQQINGMNNVILLQGLYGNGPGTSIGMISAYNASNGQLANGTSGNPTFGDGGSGYIYYNSFGLNMAQLYSAVINEAGDIFVAYGNSDTRNDDVGQIDVAAFKKDGSGLITEFGVNGVVSNVLSSSNQKFWNVNIAAASNGNILVSSCDDVYVNVARLDGVTGLYDTSFNSMGDILGLQSIALADTNISSLQGLSDGSLMITGYIEVYNSQQFMIRVAEDGNLDTTFNPEGLTPGIYLNQVGGLPSCFYGLAVQSTTGVVGDLVAVGTQYSLSDQNNPTITRVFGQPGTTAVKNYPLNNQYPGTLDLQLNGTGFQDLTDIINSGIANVVFAYPAGNVYEGKLLVTIDNGTTTAMLARLDETYMTIDTNFGLDGSGMYAVPSGVSCLSIDSNNNILIGGTSGSGEGAGWAQQITPDGTSAIAFQFPATNIQVNAIGEQKSGRYIVAGQNVYTQNEVYAFQDQLVDDNTMLQLDPTFNPLGGNTSPNGPLGCFVIGAVSSGIYSLAINSDDTIIVSSQDGATSNVQIAKIAANGAGLVSGFGDDGTGIALTPVLSDNTSSSRIVIDNDGNIIIAASGDSGLNVQVIRYTSQGVLDTTWNSGAVTTISSSDIGTSVVLTSMLETVNNQTILLGYNESDSPGGYLFAIRLDDTGVLDQTWNPQGSTPGVLSFYINLAWTMGVQSWIGVSGNIWTTSYGDSPNLHPSLIEIVGDTYVQQIVQAPLAAPAGTLDYTLDPSGALSLINQFSYEFGSPGEIAILSDQSMIMAWNTEGLTITKINPVLDLDTSFNGSSQQPGIPGQVYVPVPGGYVYDLFVADAQGDNGVIYVAGGDPTMWGVKISADGSTAIQLTAANNLTVGGAIRQTPAGNILIAGYNGSSGVLAEFSADMTSLNTSFGQGGYYLTGVDSPIYAMTIDADGFMYIAYKQAAEDLLVVQRIFANGSGVDASFDPILTTPCDNPQRICLQLDQVNEQLVVASQSTPDIDIVVYIHRYSTIDGSDTGGDVQVAISDSSCNLASLFIDTDQNIYAVGYTPTPTYTTFVARILSTNSTSIALDTQNYAADSNTPGIANVVAGQLSGGDAFNIVSGILDQDRRVYVVGTGSDYNPYMARFFGDNYYTQISQAIPLIPSGGPAKFDATYGVNGIATLSAGIVPNAGQEAFGILPIATGTNIMTLITNADGTQSWTARQLPDGSNDATYTAGGPGNGIAIAQSSTGLDFPLGMVFDGSGNAIVYGFNTELGGFVKSIVPSGAMNSAFNGAPTTPAGTSYLSQFIAINAVAQLSNGNFVCVGKENSNNLGLVVVLNPNGQLISGTSQNFGTNITSVSIDAQDNMYLAVGADETASVIKLNSLGVVDTSYVANDVITNLYDTETIRLVLNAAGNIVIAASVNGDTGLVNIVGLTSNGSIDSDFNQLSIPFATNTNGVLTSLIALQNGNLLLAGYQHDFTDSDNMDFEFVASVTSAGQFDTTFNPGGSPAGLLLFQVASGEQEDRNLWAMNVQSDGKILLAGSEESMDSIATPLTMRLDGYPGVKAIQQFIGAVPVVPSLLNPAFNQTGIAFTPVVDNLVDGGSIVVDSQGRVIIAGRTTDANSFVAMRFLPDGTLDQTFNNTGVTQTPALISLMSGSFVAVDADDNVYVGGVTSDATFLVARFLGSNGYLDELGFNSDGLQSGIPGIAESYSLDNNLNYGGYVAIDYLGNVLVAGSGPNNCITLAQFLPNGSISGNYGQIIPGLSQSNAITGLVHGGWIATAESSPLFADDNSCYIGGVTISGGVNTLVVAKFDGNGNVDTNFGIEGIAQSTSIAGLVDGGPIALDSSRKIVVGGFTSNKVFVATRFLSSGLFDPDFNGGIAYSSALTSLNSCLGICVDLNDNIILGGISTAYDGVSNSMVIARMTVLGAIDTTLSSTGIASTGIIDGLVSGGFVATNVLNNPFIGGYDGTQLVVAEMYSGAEIFIADPSTLPAGAYKIYWFGNILELFQNYLAIPVFAEIITDLDVQADLIAKVQNSLSTYAAMYEGQPNLNLLANTTPGWDGQLNQVRLLLLLLHPESEDQINNFFTNFNERRFIIHDELAGFSTSL